MKASFSNLHKFLNVYATKTANGIEDLEAYVQDAKATLLLKYRVTSNLNIHHTLQLDFACPFRTRLQVLNWFCRVDDTKVHGTLAIIRTLQFF